MNADAKQGLSDSEQKALQERLTGEVRPDVAATAKLHPPYLRIAVLLFGVAFTCSYTYHDLNIGKLTGYLALCEHIRARKSTTEGAELPPWFSPPYVPKDSHADRHRLNHFAAFLLVTIFAVAQYLGLLFARCIISDEVIQKTNLRLDPLDSVMIWLGAIAVVVNAVLIVRMIVARALIRRYEFLPPGDPTPSEEWSRTLLYLLGLLWMVPKEVTARSGDGGTGRATKSAEEPKTPPSPSGG